MERRAGGAGPLHMFVNVHVWWVGWGGGILKALRSGQLLGQSCL